MPAAGRRALAGLTLMLGSFGFVHAADAPGEAADAVAAARGLDIPAQPLAAALERYGALTGLPVFFDSALVAGRSSSEVRDAATPAAALHLLLRGTGLTASRAGTDTLDAFVLKADDDGRTASDGAPKTEAAIDRPDSHGYDGLLQTRIWEAFCANPRTEPGGYRTAMRFAVDGTGRIAHAFLLHTTGDRARDGAILDTLRRIQLDRPPPADMPQPITMVILPRALTPGLECRARH